MDCERSASELLLTAATTEERIAVRGCDLRRFQDGRIQHKDSY